MSGVSLATTSKRLAQEREAFSSPGRAVFDDAGVRSEIIVKDLRRGSARDECLAEGFGG